MAVNSLDMGQQMNVTNFTTSPNGMERNSRDSWLYEAQTLSFLTAKFYGNSFKFHRLCFHEMQLSEYSEITVFFDR
jgi:hypothetical protein